MKLAVWHMDGGTIFEGDADGATVSDGTLSFVSDGVMHVVPLTAFEHATLDLPEDLGDDEEDNL